MTMVVVARLLDLPQARVAASALRSAGLHPVLLEEQQCSIIWPYMYALGGCRVAVPGSEIEDAAAILQQPDERLSKPLSQADRIDRTEWGWRTVAALLGLGLLMPYLGWLVLGVRWRRGNFAPTMVGIVLATLAVVPAMVVLTVIVVFLAALTDPVGFRQVGY